MPLMNLRITPEEKTRWESAASTSGLSLSAWLRTLANKACEPTPVTTHYRPTSTPRGELCPRCRRIGTASCEVCKKVTA